MSKWPYLVGYVYFIYDGLLSHSITTLHVKTLYGYKSSYEHSIDKAQYIELLCVQLMIHRCDKPLPGINYNQPSHTTVLLKPIIQALNK